MFHSSLRRNQYSSPPREALLRPSRGRLHTPSEAQEIGYPPSEFEHLYQVSLRAALLRRASRGGAGPRAGRQRPQKGADLRYTLSISLEEAAAGCEKVISFLRNNGTKEENAKLAVTVPAGVKENQKLKLTGEGDGSLSGQAGDLYVIIQIQEHSLFKREENDIVLELPVSYIDAILGTSIEVPTLTGRVLIKIPPGTHTGQALRLKGKGLPKMGGFGSGDMLIKILVDTPQEVSAAERELLNKLSQTASETPLIKEYKEKVQKLSKYSKS